jgi:hypothetical protein
MQTLRDENERLSGHRNPLQRIHHLQAVKQERNDLKLVWSVTWPFSSLVDKRARYRTLALSLLEMPESIARAVLTPHYPRRPKTRLRWRTSGYARCVKRRALRYAPHGMWRAARPFLSYNQSPTRIAGPGPARCPRPGGPRRQQDRDRYARPRPRPCAPTHAAPTPWLTDACTVPSPAGRPAAKQPGLSVLAKVPGPGAKAKPEPKENIPS